MFDLLFLLVVGLSTAFAAMRGGLRELATLLALAVAAGLTWLLAEPLLGLTGLADSFFGALALIGVLLAVFFILAHLGFHLGLRRVPLDGNARTIDRVSGGAFGLFRGLVLIGLGYLGYSYYLDEAQQPDSVRNALSQPIAAGMANWFEGFAPESAYIENEGAITTDENGNAALEGYGRSDRNGLEEIVTTVTTTDPAILETSDQEDQQPAGEEDPIADILIQEDER